MRPRCLCRAGQVIGPYATSEDDLQGVAEIALQRLIGPVKIISIKNKNGRELMYNRIHHGGYLIGSVDYVHKSLRRLGAFIRYIVSAETVIWLFKSDIEAHYAQLYRPGGNRRPEVARRNLR